MSKCSECDRPAHALGLCSGHHRKFKRHGERGGLLRRLDMSPLDRYLSYVEQRGPDDCWPWKGFRSPKNYGQVANGRGGSMGAHRFGFAALLRPLRPGETVDHLCHGRDLSCPGGDTCEHRACQNPAHWEAVSDTENVARGRSFSARNAAKTHCVRGHELTPDNCYESQLPRRMCKRCNRDKARANYDPAKQRAYRASKK